MTSSSFLYCVLLMLAYCSADDGHNYYHNIRTNVKSVWGDIRPSDQSKLAEFIQELSTITHLETVLKTVDEFSKKFDMDAFDLNDVSGAMNAAMGISSQSNSSDPNAISLPKVSPQCWKHTIMTVTGLFGRKSWAIKMLDALFKPPAGLMTGKAAFLGDYDECLDVQADDEFKGQYCLATIFVTSIQNPVTHTKGYPLKAGLCVPSTCTKTDISNLLNAVLPSLSNQTVFASDVSCQEPDRPYDTKAKIALGVIAVFIGLMSIATLYDVIIQHFVSPQKNSLDLDHKIDGVDHKADGIEHISEKGNIINGYELKTNAPDVPQQTNNDGTEYKYKLSQPELSLSFQESNTEAYKPGIAGKLLLSFSIYSNGAKLLSAKQGAGTLTAVNGIRFISMSWVILGHTFGFGPAAVDNVAQQFQIFIKRISFMAIINAEVSVDTFFTLSGTLLTYLVLRQLKKQKGRLNWFMFYFHRFWRLTPPYMLVMMVFLTLYPYLGSGPMWPKEAGKDSCRDTWWTNLLYINNFVTVTDECMAWAWYLANDMQFFVASPVIIIAMYKSKIAGTIVTGVFLVGTSIATGSVSKHFELGITTFGRGGGDYVYFDQYYQRPYCRMQPYLVGMYTGYLLYKTNCKCIINKVVNLILWAVFAASASAVLYGVYEDFNGNYMSIDVAVVYNTLHKTVWGAAVSWVIFACATGNGGFINTILSWKGFIPLSRLTYCAYLIHPVVMYYFYMSRKQMIHWDIHEIIYEFIAHIGLSYAAAFVTSLAFESPMMALEKVIFKQGNKK